MRRIAPVLLGLLGLGIVVAAGRQTPGSPPMKLGAEGLHNLLRINAKLYSGAEPEGEKAFAALKRLGIRTVISVDGARPAVELARKYGMRYVHIPIGYNGAPREQALRLARAVSTLPGPFYVHCHHGKHRGPAAAALARVCLEKCRTGEALEVLRRAGTDPRYRGLFRSVEAFRPPSAADLEQGPGDLPEVAPLAGMRQAMVAIDRPWDGLKQARAAGWKTPPDHPDIEPAHEAKLLVEAFRQAHGLPELARRPADFRRWLAEGAEAARQLEAVLRPAKVGKRLDLASAEKAFLQGSRSCTECHARYRDVP